MTIYNWLSLFGIPAIILAILTATYKQLNTRTKRTAEINDAIKMGVRAMLRDRLYQLYRYCRSQGGATHSERENFNNLYEQYHTLGGNGVMRDIRDKFFALPIKDDD